MKKSTEELEQEIVVALSKTEWAIRMMAPSEIVARARVIASLLQKAQRDEVN